MGAESTDPPPSCNRQHTVLSRTSVKACSRSTSLGSHTQRFWNTLQPRANCCSVCVSDGSDLGEGGGRRREGIGERREGGGGRGEGEEGGGGDG